jgi:predicted nucleic acid-binding protein
VIVADTNLLAYFLLPGPHHSTARAVFTRDPAWHVPLLWRSELANIFILTVRHQKLPLTHAATLWETAAALLAGKEHPVSGINVIETAHRHGLTAYDAEFVTLAEGLGVPLVTTDSAILNAVPQLAKSPLTFAKA